MTPTRAAFYDEFDKIRVYYVTKYNTVTQYIFYYRHYIKFAKVDTTYDLEATLTFCKMDTEVCEDFNMTASYLDID